MNKKVTLRNERYSFLQVLLTVISVACLLISNVITSKQMQFPFGLTMTGAIYIFPVTYILSDVFSEVYGYRWSRITCYMGFAMNVVMVLAFELAIASPAPSYWGNQEAFETVLGSAPRVLVASLSVYNSGVYSNSRMLFGLSVQGNAPKFGIRAIASSFFGEVADSLVFIPIAFLGQMPIESLVQMLIAQVVLKTAYEVIILPITTIVVNKVDKYERGA